MKTKKVEKTFEKIIAKELTNLMKILVYSFNNCEKLKEIHTYTGLRQIGKSQRRRENLESSKKIMNYHIQCTLSKINSSLRIRNH